MKIKKYFKGTRGKQMLVSCLAVMVLATGYYRWYTESQNEETVPVTADILPTSEMSEKENKGVEKTEEVKTDTETDYFAKARYERDCARSETTELLKVSAQNKGTMEADNGKNAEALAMHIKNMESEAVIESLVKSKGYSDCIAFVEDNGVRVVVKSDSLEADGVAKIKDIVIEQTGVKAVDIKISGKK